MFIGVCREPAVGSIGQIQLGSNHSDFRKVYIWLAFVTEYPVETH